MTEISKVTLPRCGARVNLSAMIQTLSLYKGDTLRMFIRRANNLEESIDRGGKTVTDNHFLERVLELLTSCPVLSAFTARVNMQYRRQQRIDQNAVFRKRVVEYLVDELRDMDIDFATTLISPLAKERPRQALRRTRSTPFNTRSAPHPNATDQTAQHEALVNRHRRKVAFDPKVNHIGAGTENPSLLNYETDDSLPLLGEQSSSDGSSNDESGGNASEVFEFEEPAVNNIGDETKYCELCNGSKDHNTWECKKFDSCNIPKDERRKIKQCRIRFHKELVHRRKELGLPPPSSQTYHLYPSQRDTSYAS